MREIKIIGLMSGTSLDGLDICYAAFHKDDEGKWQYRVIAAESESYPQELKTKLAECQNMTAQEYALLHSDYGIYLGERTRAFIERNSLTGDLRPDYIASHGSTVFHQPSIRFTAQIGSGAGIAAETGIDTICDFRTTDVALHGQGAPLVPVGDRNLFGDFSYCLNLGGFSNISFEDGRGGRTAYDICPVNYVMNHYTRQQGLDYDKDGDLARSGKVCEPLLESLNALPFYNATGPKSLGREWVEKEIFPLIDSFGLSLNDILSTWCEHVAVQIGRHAIEGRTLLTGGGALNIYLVERMRACCKSEIVVPDRMTIDFKEALIFAFLGALYVSDEPNCMNTVTGARYSCIGGALYKAGGKI